MTLATIADTLRSRKRGVLAASAILLVGTTLAIGQSGSEGTKASRAPAANAESPANDALSASQRKEVEALIRSYLIKNPEILIEVQNALEAKMAEIQRERTRAILKDNADEIFRPAFSGVAGNPAGDIPVVEFFDYNCGYCKRAFGSVAALLKKEKKVRFILKEFPILSKGSEEAARVALAAKMQGKYWEFHSAMLTENGRANEASALRVAERIGLDVDRLRKDMTSPEVKQEIAATKALAQKLGIQGTPHFMVGDRVIPGAPQDLLQQMTKLVTEVRQEGCKVC